MTVCKIVKKKKQKKQNKAGTDENQTQYHKQKMQYGHKRNKIVVRKKANMENLMRDKDR